MNNCLCESAFNARAPLMRNQASINNNYTPKPLKKHSDFETLDQLKL